MKDFRPGIFKGKGLKARALRSSALSIIEIGGSNILRLVSNLILTRLLFPEAFGMMALVQVFVVAVKMFSDIGLRTSIIRSDREDEAFLNTAWTLQIIRGFILWLAACAVALPVAALYDEPMLAQILPVTGLSAFIIGFATTNIATTNRKLMLGRITFIDLATQGVNIVVTVILAWWLESVWALVIGGLLGSLLNTAAPHWALPGIRNRLHWDWSAFHELFSFGKFIFLASAVTFLINQGDKLILGAYVSMADLGIYNVGYFLGTLPLMISQALNTKVVFPLYKHRPMSEGPKNRAKVFRARRMVIGFSLAMTMVLAYTGIWLIEFLYDPRYSMAGPVVVLFSLCLVPRLVNAGSGAVLLAAGDSRNFFFLNATTAVVQTVLMFALIGSLGIFAVIAAPAIATILVNPLRIHFTRKHHGWDWRGDATLFSLGLVINGLACWLHWEDLVRLMG